jgi:arylsulfatase A-like enzyme
LAVAPRSGGAKRTATQPRPNVVVVMTDDQTLLDLRQRHRGKPVMPNVLKLIAAKGAEFRNAYAGYPLSCPSRMTFLTGRYAHNHGVTTNAKPGFNYCAGFFDRTHTMPLALQAAGYHTGHMGRYLNGYGYTGPKEYIPPGYDEWHAPVGKEAGTAATFSGYYMNDDGVITGKHEEYFTDRINSEAVDFINSAPEPFFFHLAHRAPHEDSSDPVGPAPAERHKGSLKKVPLLKSPSFDEKDISDKPRFLRPANRLKPRQKKVLRVRNQRRLESLRAVDEGVKRIIDALAQSGNLADTYIIFQSDNGFFRGEHRITKGKTLAYEPSARIPILIRGPGIPAGGRPKALVSNVDVAPTIGAITGVAPTKPFDGTSLLPFARKPSRKSKRALLIESYALTIDESGKLAGAAFIPKRLQRYQAIRFGAYKYIRLLKSKEQELYNLKKDPDELENLAKDKRYRGVAAFFRGKLKKLARCKGKSCRKPIGAPPKPLPKK